MATANAIEIPIADEPVKPIDGVSGPRHDSMGSNASTAVDNRKGQGEQKENHHQSSFGSYFPPFVNVPQVLKHQNPAQGPGVLDTTMFHNRRVNDKHLVRWRYQMGEKVWKGQPDRRHPLLLP